MGGHATSVYREPVWQQCLKFAVAHRFSAYGIVASVFLLALIAAWFPLYTISRIEHSREVRQLEQAVKNQSLENLKNLARETARNIELATQNYDLQLSMIRNSPLIDELAQASTSMNLEQRQIQLDSSLRLSNGDVLLLLDEPGNPSVAWQVKSQDTIEQSTEIDPTHHEDLDLRVQGSNDKSRTWSTLSLGVSDSASMPRLVAAIHNTEESSPIQLVALIGEPESRLFPSPAQLQQRQGPALFMFVQLPSKKRSGYTSYFETYVDPKSSIDRQREFTSLRLAASNPLGIQLTEGYAEWLNQPAASRGDFFEAQGTGPVSAELEHNYSAWKALVYPLMERQSSIAEDNPLALVLLTPQ